MAPRHDVEDVALLCERPGRTSTLIFPDGSRAKFHHDLIPFCEGLRTLLDPSEWGTCDICDRVVASDSLARYEEGSQCERCHGWGWRR